MPSKTKGHNINSKKGLCIPNYSHMWPLLPTHTNHFNTHDKNCRFKKDLHENGGTPLPRWHSSVHVQGAIILVPEIPFNWDDAKKQWQQNKQQCNRKTKE